MRRSPSGDRLILGDRVIELQVAKLDAALLYVFAMLSLGVYGVILAGFASRNNYAIMGGLRATAQMISYEIALGVSIIGVVMVYETTDLSELVRAQGQTIGGWIPFWGILTQPVAFFVFVTAALAETKRLPFDLPEGESEIIGYFVEYSGMKFGMFFLTDFLETILVATLVTTLFFGGWQVPYLMPDGFHFPWGGELLVSNWVYVLLGFASFSIKGLVFMFVFMQLRWTLPRFRYDQLMSLGWKGALPDRGGQRRGDGPRAQHLRGGTLMATIVVRRPELTFWEKLYIPQIMSGLRITFRHFFRNLFLHTAHLVGSPPTPSRLGHHPVSRGAQAPHVAIPKPPQAHPARRQHSPLRRVHALRDSVPGQVHHYCAWRASRSPHREVPGPLRH